MCFLIKGFIITILAIKLGLSAGQEIKIMDLSQIFQNLDLPMNPSSWMKKEK